MQDLKNRQAVDSRIIEKAFRKIREAFFMC